MTLADFLNDVTAAIAALVPNWQVIVLGAIVIFAALRVLRGLRVTGR
ncbi:MAG: hypothetical protein QXI60_08320 [Thermofilaceae archaeon]